MAQIRTLKLNLLADVTKFGAGMVEARGDVNKLSTAATRAGEAIKTAFAGIGIAAGYAAARLGKEAVAAASDLNEATSKTQVIFGDVSDEILKFSKTTAKSLGLSQKAALDASSTFATFGKAAGLTGKDLTNFSTKLVGLSADFASFYNTSPEDAITAIGAALRGESEPIRRYGVLLDDATLKAKAMEMGLYDGKGALDLQAKSLAAYQSILDQSKDAQGDFSRTSEGLANQQRILTAETENLKAALGTSLLPVMTNIISTISQVATGFSGGTGSLADAMSAVTREGYYSPSGGENLGSALRNVADAMGKLFDSINGDGKTAAGNLQTIANALNFVADNLERINNLLEKGKTGSFLDKLKAALLLGGAGLGLKGITGGRASGGSISGAGVYRVGEFGSEMFVPNGVNGSIRKDTGGSGTVINISGAIDPEGVRRQLERLFQDSGRRTAAVNLAGAAF